MLPYGQYLVVLAIASGVSKVSSLPTYNFTLDDFVNINNMGAPRSGFAAPAYNLARSARDGSVYSGAVPRAGNAAGFEPAPLQARQSQLAPQYYRPRTSRDLELSESGYIFRSDDNSPPMLIKLGAADDTKFSSMLKKAGISMPKDGITFSSPGQDQTVPHVYDKDGYKSSPQVLERDRYKSKQVKTYVPTSSVSSEFEDFKLNPVALAPSSGDVSDEHDSPSGGNKPITEDEVSYTYSQEPIRFEYISHSADDDGYEELLKRLNGGDGGSLEEVYRMPVTSGKPLYESARSFEGYDQGSPSIDLKLDTKSGLSKSYIAPIFELPSTFDSSFDRHTPPVKYKLNKKPKYTAPLQSDQPLEEDGHQGYDVHEDGHHGRHAGHGFEHDGGHYDNSHHNEHGHSHDKGYKDYNEYSNKEKSKYDKGEDKSFYNGKDGHKKHHYNEGDKYGEHHNKKKGVKGSKFGESGYHKKGHKTNGYHNIFHKDEFKKEHKFYDDAKKEGFFDKYGNYHKKSGTKKGGKDGKGFHESGYDSSHNGKDGLYDKGFLTKEHKGSDGKSGHSSGFANVEDVDKKYGHDEEKKYGGYSAENHR